MRLSVDNLCNRMKLMLNMTKTLRFCTLILRHPVILLGLDLLCNVCCYGQTEDLQRTVKATIHDAQAGVVEVWAYAGDGPRGPGNSSERHAHLERLLKSGVDVAPPAKGSGFVVSLNGLIVTAGHLVCEAQHVVVQTARRMRYRAEVALID
ncbi:MAG: hypothetical protein ACI9OU_001286 [Candidatus Promineifilaceae bacterium]|jgi:hypothetical protein